MSQAQNGEVIKNKEIDAIEIKKVFAGLPVQDILVIANKIKGQIQSDPSLVEIKSKKEYVTKADFDIQRLILRYLVNSSLAGSYRIKAEEELSAEEKGQNDGIKSWQLIIDPLDGTSAFCKGADTWGVMVGACDADGKLICSWNMVSDGNIFSSGMESGAAQESLAAKVGEKGKVRVDVYDYGAGASEKFPAIFEKNSGFKAGQYEQTSYPAAVWAGWELFTGKLDGMLWLPSNEGKKNYPDYDLIFLGALQQKGLKIRLGKVGESVEMIAIAPTAEDLEMLYEVGLEMISEEKRKQLQAVDELKITTAI